MKRKLVGFLVLISIFSGIYFSHSFILEGMARYLIVSDKLGAADIILVLGGDDNGERVNQGVRLYKEGYAKKMLLSGGPLAWELTSAEWMKKQALALGIPAHAIVQEDKSRSTIENAKFTLPVVKMYNFTSIILVTSPTHSRRAKRVFNKVYSKEGIRIISYPAQEGKFRLPRWWTRHEDTQLVVWEYVSLVYYLLKGY